MNRGSATINKQPGGYYRATDRYGIKERRYKHKSDGELLAQLVSLLKRQGKDYQVTETKGYWKVNWV